MQHTQQLNNLIDAARKVVGSDYKLAKMLEVSPQNISNWRHGHKPCPAADMALMANIAGLDAQAWLVRATIEKYEGTPKGDALYKALGKALLATGAAVASSGASAAAIYGLTANNWLDWVLIASSTMCRKVKFLCAKSIKGPRGPFFFRVTQSPHTSRRKAISRSPKGLPA